MLTYHVTGGQTVEPAWGLTIGACLGAYLWGLPGGPLLGPAWGPTIGAYLGTYRWGLLLGPAWGFIIGACLHWACLRLGLLLGLLALGP